MSDAMHNEDWIVPPEDAVRYGRRQLQNEVERLRRFEDQALAKGDPAVAVRWRRARNIIERDLLGYGEGCVITAFDSRWLDPEFRRVMTEVRSNMDAAPASLPQENTERETR